MDSLSAGLVTLAPMSADTARTPWLSDLTEPQRQAVTHVDGPLLVLAGPGSGKTRVITRRMAHLVSLGIPAWNILALTFTNKAAGEMRRRVESLLPPDVPGRRGLVVSTFHAFSAMVLRRNAEAAGLREGFAIFDSADQRDVMKQAIAEHAGGRGHWTPAAVLSEVSRLKNALLGPDEARSSARDFRARAVADLYAAYQQRLGAANAVDFDDLLLRMARMLGQDEAVRRALQERFRYLMVDEYQDTNRAQFEIARHIAGHGNIVVVGDPDQSIYGWRGADLGNIMDFEASFPGASVVALGENFRSTAHIVSAASGLIRNNRRRRHKDLTTSLGDGRPVTVIRCNDEHQEAEQVVEALMEANRAGVPWRGMAVLYRMNALSRVLEESLRRREVPYQIVRGTAFFERREVKDALSYLRALANPRDAVSLRRIVNVPARGVGETSAERLVAFAGARGMQLLEALGHGADAGLTGRAASAAAELGRRFSAWAGLAEQGSPAGLPDLVRTVLEESGLTRHYAAMDAEEPDEGEARSANLGELVSAAAEWLEARPEGDDLARADAAAGWDAGRPPRTAMEALRSWLESVALVADSDAFDPERGAVTLMTLHAAKGLEFPLVAMVGLEEGLLPHARSADSPDELEEERRLCFVGMTRAERTLVMTSAAARLVQGQRMSTIESQFLQEIPREHVHRIDRTGDAWVGGGDELAARRSGSGRAGAIGAGMEVRHPLFGPGKVLAVNHLGRATSVRVAFRSVGVKTLVLEYARLEVIR